MSRHGASDQADTPPLLVFADTCRAIGIVPEPAPEQPWTGGTQVLPVVTEAEPAEVPA